MEKAVNFESKLKEYKQRLEKRNKELNIKYNKLKEKYNDNLNNCNFFVKNLYKFLINCSESQGENLAGYLKPELLILLKQVEELKIKIQFLDNELELLENLIDFYENDNRLKPLSSDIFINIIKRMYLEHEVNGTEISINLGKLIYLNYTFVKRGVTEVENAELIEKLGEYFNKDGSFKYNENVEEFYSLLNLLENKSKRKFPYLNFCDILSDIIIQSLKCSNNNFRNNSEDDVTYDKQISLEAYKYIRNYYQNGKIILLPSDLEYFSEMLDKAGYSENDKAYILNLIEKTSLKYKQTSFIIHNSESRTRKKLFNVNNKGLLNSLAIHKHF